MCVPQDVLQHMRSLSSDYHWVAIGGSLKNSGMFIDTVRRIFEEQTGCAFVKHGSGKKYGATVNEGRPVCGHHIIHATLRDIPAVGICEHSSGASGRPGECNNNDNPRAHDGGLQEDDMEYEHGFVEEGASNKGASASGGGLEEDDERDTSIASHAPAPAPSSSSSRRGKRAAVSACGSDGTVKKRRRAVAHDSDTD